MRTQQVTHNISINKPTKYESTQPSNASANVFKNLYTTSSN